MSLSTDCRPVRKETAMATSFGRRARLSVDRLECREVPAFMAPVASPGGGGQVATGDVNHDGRDDIAVVGGKRRIAVSLSRGDGTFQLAAPLTPGKLPGGTGTYRTDLHMADVNRDGNP